MGNKIERKFITLIVLFLCACIVIYTQDSVEQKFIKPPLKEFLANIEGYTLLHNNELSENAVSMLDLDDYFFSNFQYRTNKINLYIGYYYSLNKAYASHSPTVCYPSQGWSVDSDPITKKYKVGKHEINYNEITTSFGKQRELVIYWYQARLQTNTQPFKNKIDIGINRLVFNDGSHGFVRIAVPFSDSDYEKTKKEVLFFIRSFYPQFERYLIQGPINGTIIAEK